MFEDAEETLHKNSFCSTHLRVTHKKREYPIFTLGEKLWLSTETETSFCYVLTSEGSHSPSSDPAPGRRWLSQVGKALGVEFSSVWAHRGSVLGWEVRESLYYTYCVRRPDLLLFRHYVRPVLFKCYLHHAALPEQTFPSTFQTKRSARQNCFKLTFLWKGFLMGKDCVNTWFATSPFWLVLRRVAVSACHHLL